jgi:hypothetical protein
VRVTESDVSLGQEKDGHIRSGALLLGAVSVPTRRTR